MRVPGAVPATRVGLRACLRAAGCGLQCWRANGRAGTSSTHERWRLYPLPSPAACADTGLSPPVRHPRGTPTGTVGGEESTGEQWPELPRRLSSELPNRASTIPWRERARKLLPDSCVKVVTAALVDLWLPPGSSYRHWGSRKVCMTALFHDNLRGRAHERSRDI